MLPLTKKLLLKRHIGLVIDDYNSHHKMCRPNDFREHFVYMEDLILDLLIYKRDNEAVNLDSLLDLKPKILIIDDYDIARDYWYAYPRDRTDFISKDEIESLLKQGRNSNQFEEMFSQYFLIIEVQFLKMGKSILSSEQVNLSKDNLFVSLISRNNLKESTKEYFEEVLVFSYSNKNKQFFLKANGHKGHPRDSFPIVYGPWPKPKIDWIELVKLPIPEEVLNLFKRN